MPNFFCFLWLRQNAVFGLFGQIAHICLYEFIVFFCEFLMIRSSNLFIIHSIIYDISSLLLFYEGIVVAKEACFILLCWSFCIDLFHIFWESGIFLINILCSVNFSQKMCIHFLVLPGHNLQDLLRSVKSWLLQVKVIHVYARFEVEF